jgi:hypothetical protein
VDICVILDFLAVGAHGSDESSTARWFDSTPSLPLKNRTPVRPGDPRSGYRYRQLKVWAKATFRWVCVYCGTPIPAGHRQDRWDCTVAHRVPVSVRPDLACDRANVLGLAHRGCNTTAYAEEERQQPGAVWMVGPVRSENW